MVKIINCHLLCYIVASSSGEDNLVNLCLLLLFLLRPLVAKVDIVHLSLTHVAIFSGSWAPDIKSVQPLSSWSKLPDIVIIFFFQLWQEQHSVSSSFWRFQDDWNKKPKTLGVGGKQNPVVPTSPRLHHALLLTTPRTVLLLFVRFLVLPWAEHSAQTHFHLCVCVCVFLVSESHK